MSDDKKLRCCKGLEPSWHGDGIYWIPKGILCDPRCATWRYAITQYPFVPGYNVIEFAADTGCFDDEHVISNHKTLTEAKAILMILLSTPGAITYDD